MLFVLNLRKRKKFLFIVCFFIFFILFIIFFNKALNYIFPIKYENVIEKYAKEFDLEKSLVFAVINAESRFDENAVSPKGAKGLMQILPDTAIWIADKANFTNITYNNYTDIENNIMLGTWYLSYFLQKSGNLELALAAYNAGYSNVLTWLDTPEYSKDGKTLDKIPFEETENYIKKISILKKGYDIIFYFKDKF